MKKVKTKSRLHRFLSALLVFATISGIFSCVPALAVAAYNERADYNVSEIIVKYKSLNSYSKGIKKYKGKYILKKHFDSSKIKVIDVLSTDKMAEAISTLSKDPNIEYAVPNDRITTYGFSDEPLFTQQTELTENYLNVSSAWKFSSGENVIIGVMDTGIDASHSDIAPNILSDGKDFVNNDNTLFDAGESSHGTNVCGIIAAAENNSGITGVAPKAKILPLKVIENNVGYVSTVIEAIEYAKTLGADIINCSWGTNEFNLALKDAIKNSNMLFVCSAGNQGSNVETYPAAFELSNVISVGSTDLSGAVADFCNKRQNYDLYAPGVNVLTTAPDNSYSRVSGTSFSAAYISGIAALIKQAVPSATADELAAVLSEGYTLNEKNIKVADAAKAIHLGLPLNFIKNENDRLTKAMNDAKLLITPDIAELLTVHETYGSLSAEDKSVLSAFFHFNNGDFTACDESGMNLSDSVIALIYAQISGISAADIIELSECFSSATEFDKEIGNLIDIFSFIDLSDIEKQTVLGLMRNNHKSLEVSKALIFSKSTGMNLNDIITPANNQSFTADTPFEQLAQQYKVKSYVVSEYAREHELSAEQLSLQLYTWQQKHGFFATDSVVSPCAAVSMGLSSFGKYQPATTEKWYSGNSSVNTHNGMLGYTVSLLSLAEKNENSFNLSIRFDPEVSDYNSQIKEPDLINVSYSIVEKKEYYSSDLSSRLQDLDNENTYTTDNYLIAESYIARDGQCYQVKLQDNTEVCYITRITVSTSFTGNDFSDDTKSNYYDSIYGLGVGWSLSLPSVEIVGTQKYLHLPDGRKFKINSDNSINGYSLSDLTFSPDDSFQNVYFPDPDYSIGCILPLDPFDEDYSSYSLTEINGLSYYFDSSGRCMGIVDLYGNKTSISYDEDGLIDEITDPSGRIIYFARNKSVNNKQVLIRISEGSSKPFKTLYTVNESKNTDNQYILSGISDGTNRSTQFEYGSYNLDVQYNNAAMQNSGKALYLSEVISQSGVHSEYTYTAKTIKYGVAGTKKCYSVISSSDRFGSQTYNNISYETNNLFMRLYPDSSVYPPSNAADAQNAVRISGNVKEVIEFNNDLIAVKNQTRDNDSDTLKAETQTVSMDMYNQPTEKTEKTYSESGDYTVVRTQMQWDSYGNCISRDTRSGNQDGLSSGIDEKYYASYFDGTNIAQTITRFSDKKEGEYYGTKTVNTIDASKKKILQTSVSSCKINGDTVTDEKLLYTISYNYNKNGQTVSTAYAYANDNNALTNANKSLRITEVSYDKFGVHPKTTVTFGRYYDGENYTDGIKNADGTFIIEAFGNKAKDKTETAYNFLGQLTERRKNNGIKEVYIYDENTNELTETKYYNGSKLLGSETSITDYTNRCIITTDFKNVHTKTKYDAFWNPIKVYKQTKDSIGTDNVLYRLAEKHIYDAYERLTDTYEMLSNVAESADSEENLTASGIKFRHTVTQYDSFGRVLSETVKDRTDTVISAPIEYTYESAVEFGNSGITYNTVTKTVSSGNANNDIFSSIQYLDPFGRVRIEEQYNGGTKLYTNQYTYSDFGNLTGVSGETVNSQSTSEDHTDNSTTTSFGKNNDGSGNMLEVTSTDITDGSGQKIQSVDGNGNATYYTYDILGRLILTKKPTEKIGNTLYYSAVKTYYDENGNISEEKKQINSIGESEKFSSEKTEYDIFGRVVLRSVNTNDDGRCNITQYYYESNNSSPSRIYTGQPFPLDISGLDEIKNIGYYIDNSDNYISGIPGNTTVLNFLNELKAGFGAAAVSDSRDNALSETDTVATGYNVVFDTEPSTKYTAIVSADINCDGFVNILDLVRFKKHLAGAVTLSQIQRKAADLNFNSQLTADDLILMRKTILGCALSSFIPVPECSVQSFKYDTDGNITEYTDALGNSDIFEYDEFTGNPVSKTLRNGKVITFEYDSAGNLIKTTGSEQGAPSVTYSYEYDLIGNVLSATGDGVETDYTYDNLNRLISATTSNNGLKTQIDYLYTGKDLSKMTTIRFGNNGTLAYTVATEEYEYNETGSIESKTVSSYNGDITNETVRYSTEYGYGYTANGNVQYTTVYSSGSDAECGQFSTYRYDLSNRITKIQTTKESGTNITIREENYSYNLNDALTAKQISVLQGISDDEETYTQRNYFTDYSYDNSGALVREEHGVKQNNTNIPKNRISYSYNSSGNRIKCQNTDFENSSNSRVTDYTYDSANRLTSKSETSANSTSNSVYTYDLSGNLLTGTTTEISGNSQTTHSSTYSYDSLNRTSSVTKDGVTSDYTYDENNRRISKSVGTGTTLYYWNNDQMLCEFNPGNVSQCNYYVWGIGNEAEGMMKNGIPYSNMLNLTGDIVCTIGQTNQTEIETQYDAYGNILSGSTLTSFGYTGEYMDAETGLYYLSARFYDPELGRFTQEDDWLTDGPNLYIYCKNNPVLFSDPSGHCNAVDLVYYRRKGDIATLEKLKRLIANGDCDPRYHYDPDEVPINYISPLYSLSKEQYNQILNSSFNRKLKGTFGPDKKGYGDITATSLGPIQLFTTQKYSKEFLFINSEGWTAITYIFITTTVANWRKTIQTYDLYNEKIGSILSTLVDFGTSLFDEKYDGYIGFNANLLYQEMDIWASENLKGVILDKYSRYVSNAIYGKKPNESISLLYAACTWYHTKSFFTKKWSIRYVSYAYPWSNEVYNFSY